MPVSRPRDESTKVGLSDRLRTDLLRPKLVRLPTALFSLRLPEYVHCPCSVMYTLYCLILLCLLSVNITRKGTELYITKTAHGSGLLLPRSFRQASCCRNVKTFPTTRSLDLLSITETHIRSNETDSLLHSITPSGYKLCHRPRAHGRVGDVGFFVNHNIHVKIVDSPFYESFENIAITIGSPAFVIACVYRPPGSCSDAFCDEFFSLFEYLSSLSQNVLICGNFNIHVDAIQ